MFFGRIEETSRLHKRYVARASMQAHLPTTFLHHIFLRILSSSSFFCYNSRTSTSLYIILKHNFLKDFSLVCDKWWIMVLIPLHMQQRTGISVRIRHC